MKNYGIRNAKTRGSLCIKFYKGDSKYLTTIHLGKFDKTIGLTMEEWITSKLQYVERQYGNVEFSKITYKGKDKGLFGRNKAKRRLKERTSLKTISAKA